MVSEDKSFRQGSQNKIIGVFKHPHFVEYPKPSLSLHLSLVAHLGEGQVHLLATHRGRQITEHG
jgi:hypothetical protein